MEADSRQRLLIIGLLAGSFVCLGGMTARAASQRTQNFIIQAPTPQLAKAVAKAAESYRHDLAVYWLGSPLPAWPAPCPIRVVAGPSLAAQGVTTYNPAPVRDFQMEVIGTPERILDSVLPHEVTHTILATYFGRPLPRWADEGICTTVEHVSERSKHEIKLKEFLRSRRGIAMNQLFLLTEYPSDVLPMYAQGYSVCRFLIDQQGPRTFIRFLEDYVRHPSWTANVKKHYDYDSLAQLQEYWLAWVADGSGEVDKYAKSTPRSQPGMSGAVQQVAATSNVPNNEQPADVRVAATTSGTPSAMQLTPPTVNQVALNAQSGVARPVTNLAPINQQEAVAQAAPIGSATAVNSATSGRATAAPPATALANISGGNGWYQRKRQEIQAKNDANTDNTLSRVTSPMVPPSIRNSGTYRSAHPQPEQRISRGGQTVQGMPIGASVGGMAGQNAYQGSPRRY